jgi:hypothetical protein
VVKSGSSSISFSCEECSWHTSSASCGVGCTWLESEGVCVSAEVFNKENVGCQALSKPLCDMHQRDFSLIGGISVTDAPCFFNGPPDSVFLLCASLSSVGGDSCAVIDTNDLVGKGDERYCDDASSVFGFSYDCRWTEGYDGARESCKSIYYLSNNGMALLRFLV